MRGGAIILYQVAKVDFVQEIVHKHKIGKMENIVILFRSRASGSWRLWHKVTGGGGIEANPVLKDAFEALKNI